MSPKEFAEKEKVRVIYDPNGMHIREEDVYRLMQRYAEEQLNICDEIVVELSDNEIKIISEQELREWEQSAIEFDGFEGWIVKGKLRK